MNDTIETSCMDRPEGGWYVGTINGRLAYSDGCAAFVGKVKEEDARKGDNFKLKVEGPYREMGIAGEALITGKPYAVFNGHRFIQRCYYDEAVRRFPGVQFYTSAPHHSTFICKTGGRVVGEIMPSAVHLEECGKALTMEMLPSKRNAAA